MPGARKFSAIPVAANGSDNYYSASSTRSSSYSSSGSGSGKSKSGYGSATTAAEEYVENETDPNGSQSNNYEEASVPSGYADENLASQSTNTDDCPDCEHFKVVQLNADPADPNNCGVIGYVYTYTIRKRHRTITKMNCPKCPTRIVYVKDPPDQSGDVERRIKAADENIEFAKRQVERFTHDLEMAQQKKRDAQEERFRLEEQKYGDEPGQRRVTQSPSQSSSASRSSPASGSPSTSSANKTDKKNSSRSGSYSGSKSRSYGSSASYY